MAIVLAHTNDLSYEEWLDFRRLGVGGSDASVVCGINKWKSPIELFMEKTRQMPYQEAGEAAYWGTQLESLVKNEFTKRTGIEVIQVNQILQCETNSFMLANIDGLCQHPIYGDCIFEAKTASAYLTGEWSDNIPDAYILQVQHYMSVTGYKGAYIAVLIGGNTFKWKFVERDDELISMLVQLERAFWDGVQNNVPPPLDGSEASAKFINDKFPDSKPLAKIDLPDTAAALIQQYESASEQLEIITERKKEAENLLKQMLGDFEMGTAGERIITWKTVVQERLDSKTLKAEHPTLYKKFANKTSHRRFSIKAAS